MGLGVPGLPLDPPLIDDNTERTAKRNIPDVILT